MSFKYEDSNTRFSPTLVLCQRGHKVWLYSMGKKNDVTEEGMHEDATGDKI